MYLFIDLEGGKSKDKIDAKYEKDRIEAILGGNREKLSPDLVSEKFRSNPESLTESR